ncbi:haloacid dehalogenase-like hydrolase [Fragilaria crotonensis]|nr:haloacid dehalogenase-like hydrolase [Fragilaria crotonensis]
MTGISHRRNVYICPETGTVFSVACHQGLAGRNLSGQQGASLHGFAANVPTPTGHTRGEMRLKNLWHRATYVVVRHDAKDKTIRLLVQKRSMLKDYCPGRLDPTPGGVVGFNETYRQNAVRELEEEMGIVATEDNLKRLFSFPYEDEQLRVWGDLFEVYYDGDVKELTLQGDEVECVFHMTLSELETKIKSDPGMWMPDSLHAIRLYLQYRRDHRLNRRLLRGYSSNVEAYKIVLTDGVLQKGLPEGQAYELYKQYGTALKGLLAEGYIDGSEEAIDSFLKGVHDIDVMANLNQDHRLRQLLLDMDPTIPKYIFTASVREHAERCLKALGIDDLFVDIIDVKSCNLETKHSPSSFQAAMRIAGVTNPEACVFLDDSVRNICAARQVGWRSILVGRVSRDTGQPITADDAEAEIDVIHHFPKVLPELFGHRDQDIHANSDPDPDPLPNCGS